MVAYERNISPEDYAMYEPSTLRPRQRPSTTKLVGLEDSAYLKKRSSIRKSQIESTNAAENFRRTVKIARVMCLLVAMVLMINLESQLVQRPSIQISELRNVEQAQEESAKPAAQLRRRGESKSERKVEDNPTSKENNQEMLRRVKMAFVDIPRNAKKPTKYTKPNPSIVIPHDLESLLVDISEPRSSSEVPLFWHILKSGGTTSKDAAGMCLGKVEASESGVLEGHNNDQTLQKVRISQGTIEYVNVDTTTAQGISRAISMGLVSSKMSDIIFSPLLHESVQLFNNTNHRGRTIGLFRHPVERAVSLFHYLKQASWEPTFSEKLKKIETVEDYAISEFAENNWMVRFLTNEMFGVVTRKHLEISKEILRRKVVVGLTLDMEGSFDRFIKYLGWGENLTEPQSVCLKQYLSGGSNRNKHLVEEDTMGWKVLRANNVLDLELYDYVLQLYEEQGKIFGM